jgi:hypothetical protein
MYGRTFHKSMRGWNFTDVNGARMPINFGEQLGNNQGNENANRICWS